MAERLEDLRDDAVGKDAFAAHTSATQDALRELQETVKRVEAENRKLREELGQFKAVMAKRLSATAAASPAGPSSPTALQPTFSRLGARQRQSAAPGRGAAAFSRSPGLSPRSSSLRVPRRGPSTLQNKATGTADGPGSKRKASSQDGNGTGQTTPRKRTGGAVQSSPATPTSEGPVGGRHSARIRRRLLGRPVAVDGGH